MKFFLILLISFTLFACSSTKQVQQPDDNVSSEKFDETFDPNSLDDDDIIIAKHEETVSKTEADKVKTNPLDEKISYREANGFRVQILATKNIETATLTEQEAKDLFATMEHKVYLIFDAPLYKIRVGDVTDRNDAEEIRDTAKDYGYREAFIVPSKVNIPETKSY
ncbi:MAG: SPOR domain-containing protein [Calditrichae bacterium]|nr:SPOR domain-containing protein [Calditrichota bacterium]MCB9058414.1 SPOR domain-containing protein [Calditrichia bacterium]